MTKKQAADYIVSLYPRGESYRSWFEQTIESMVGDGNFVSKDMLDRLVRYFNDIR